MGKRKVGIRPGPEIVKSEDTKTDAVTADHDVKGKGKKTYSLQHKSNRQTSSTEASCDLPKVSLPSKLENAFIEIINKDKKSGQNYEDVSKRLTSKKLTDVYNSLSDAGFSRTHVEAAMTNCITGGGDLIDALDWLCLNTPNDELPTGFAETLQKEEEKQRQKFDQSLLSEKDPRISYNSMSTESPLTTETIKTQSQDSVAAEKQGGGMKDWILKYADQSSEEDEEEENDDIDQASYDPTKCYAELHGQLQDLKNQASIAKSSGSTEKHKALSKRLREIHLEMSSLEKHPNFDKKIKDDLKAAVAQSVAVPRKALDVASERGEAARKKDDSRENDEEIDEDFGLGMFAQAEKEPVTKSSVTVVKQPVDDVRTFEYTRSQWTGKSPKQFLIDWVRKNLPKSGPPKFKTNQFKMNRFKATVVVDRQKDGALSVSPEILCQNIKEAEHLAAVLALYYLCKGQAIHMLLPPTYRTVWLEWQDNDKKAKDEIKEKQNKPRDQFISRLLKKMKIDDTSLKPGIASEGKSSDDLSDDDDDWESLADQGLLPEMTPKDGPQTRLETHGNHEAHTNSALLKDLERRQSSLGYRKLLEVRQTLPVFKQREEILASVRNHSVVVVAGETGSGKSTQVPQFLLEDSIVHGSRDVHIVCTQPRRISATSLAKRVSQEMGEDITNSNDALVGYQIRFESRRGPKTRLLYCTTGVVLRQLQASKNLQKISHLIIDEVHERSVQSDFLMIVLKNILACRPDLKVILMSATLDSQKFSTYFNGCPVINIPGRTFPVETYFLEDVIEMTEYVVDEDSPCTLNAKHLIQEQSASVEITQRGGDSSKQKVSWTQEDISKIDRTDLSPEKYSLRTRNAVTRLNLHRINLDLISDLIKYLDISPAFRDISGAILIFLPGLADIQEMYEILTTQRHFSDAAKYQIFALHSVLSSQDQGKVFEVPPPNVRKIVIATNIAETGITIPDVVFVIDSGKAKENRYLESSQMSALEEVFISKANCKQRQGRAGRVRAGFCFRLYTHAQFIGFRSYTIPELLRVPLEELCLSIMKCEYGKPHEFLALALDPPQALAVNRAMTVLREVGACHFDGCRLTSLGLHLAALPVDVRIGKMLILAAIFGCLDQIAVIAAAMTDKSPFVIPLSKRSEADSAKQAAAVACSDHVTLYKVYSGWVQARQNGKSAEKSFLNKHFLKRATLIDIENVKDDLIKLVKSIGFEDTSASRHFNSSTVTSSACDVIQIKDCISQTNNLDPSNIAMVKAVLTAGLYPQVGCILTTPSVDLSDKSACLVETSNGIAQIHPSSVNKSLAHTGSWIVYQEKVRMSRVFVRDTTVVSPYALLLFGGCINVEHSQQIVSLDSWIKYRAVVKTGVIFKELRKSLDHLLHEKLQNPSINLTGCQLILLLKELLRSERDSSQS